MGCPLFTKTITMKTRYAVFALMMRDDDMFGMLDTGLGMLKELCEKQQ